MAQPVDEKLGIVILLLIILFPVIVFLIIEFATRRKKT